MKKVLIISAALVLALGGAIYAWARGDKPTPVKVGQVAPAFALPDQHNKVHQLKEARGKIVVLAFYPADMTKGCTIEAHKFTQALDEFKKRDVVVWGISVQDVASKKKFCDQDKITYPLLADVHKKTCKDYGVLSSLGVAHRVTYVIDKKGRVAAVDPSVNPFTAAKDALKMVDGVIAKEKKSS